ncbi:GAF domain-containing protein [Phaeobacter inhibens]|uniref:HWE histidine kinase domain-containing protein n=1 Tax=Phaeobacter inhibens TaxID=221822 RepID=UPI0021A88576|nr:HWE histidine kinase domain-containing protein [Phaeobacter inhibens]UWR79597.1 GAF domain-containing protein [Phaeobacter inhibens]
MALEQTVSTTTLTNCDREPIHQLGRVQSYGALIAVSTDWLVQHASDNLLEILGIEAQAAVGHSLGDLIAEDAFTRIRRNLSALEAPDSNLRFFNIPLKDRSQAFDVSIHQSGRHLVIEFEPKFERSERDVMSEIYPHFSQLRRDEDISRLAQGAARGLQALSGFDSVMVYQFQQDHSGQVIAEIRSDRTKKYEGMFFPASDIPVQARALYKRSLLRLIADVDDEGAAISPAFKIDGAPLDLSLAVTRAVSPIHLEYLRNMGVRASMSVSIMKDGELWGLFACHHNRPRYIDYERRTAIEMFAHVFSYELSQFETTQRSREEKSMSRLQTQLMAMLADGRPFKESLISVSEDIQDVIPHDGLVLYSDGEFHATGTTPTAEETRSLARMLDLTIGATAFSTNQLESLHEPARDYIDRCAGILAIPISKRPRDYLILCRRNISQTVEWAGDPTKPMEVGPNGVRLTPRKSFEAWQETVEWRSAPWADNSLHSANMLRTVLLEIFLKVTEANNAERARAQEQQQLLISELNHRVRNILNLMRGLVTQTKGTARTLTEFTENLDGRIHSLARAHDQLTGEQWEPASLRALITCELEAYTTGRDDEVVLTGPDALVTPVAFTTLALVLHELTTNSVKHGALSNGVGRVEIVLEEEDSGALLISWIERGGPPVAPPARRGFGSTIVENSIPHELKGDASVQYKTTGLEARFRIPTRYLDKIKHNESNSISDAPSSEAKEAPKLGGKALVVEDSFIIAMDLTAMLEDMGFFEVASASSVGKALDALAEGGFEYAVLDVNLGSEQSVPVAEELARRGIPFVLTTGYGEVQDIVDIYPPCPIVQKPVSESALAAALLRAGERSATETS